MFKALRKQLLLITLSTLLAGFSLVSIIIFTDPESSTIVVFGFFYVSLFLVSLGVMTFCGLVVRQFLASGLYMPMLVQSFRQAALVSILFVVSLLLLSQNLLYWWVALSLVLLLVSIEGFFNLKM